MDFRSRSALAYIAIGHLPADSRKNRFAVATTWFPIHTFRSISCKITS